MKDSFDDMTHEQLKRFVLSMVKDGASPEVKAATMKSLGLITADAVVLLATLGHLRKIADDNTADPSGVVGKLFDQMIETVWHTVSCVDDAMTAFGDYRPGMSAELVRRMVDERARSIESGEAPDPAVATRIAKDVSLEYRATENRPGMATHLMDSLVEYAEEKLGVKPGSAKAPPASMEDFADELARMGRPKRGDEQLN